MKGVNRWIAAALFTAVLPVVAYAAGGGKSLGKPSGIEPVHLEEIPGSEIVKVTLTEDAARRTGLQLTKVDERSVSSSRRGSDRVTRTVVPYASLIYTPDGREWVYTSPANLTFVRQEVQVAYIKDDMAVLDKGPKTGTQVVTTGAAEVYGAEFGVGH